MKRAFDAILSAIGLLFASPVLVPAMIAVWLQDFHSPFYIAPRVGRDGRGFRMVKLRSMVIGADRSGVDSTGAADKRITAVGRFVRRYKLDDPGKFSNVPGWGSAAEGHDLVRTTHAFFRECARSAGAPCHVLH